MARKKWTVNEEVTDSLLRFREKRKWQLTLRRYVLEKSPCDAYAVYFGLNIESFRQWIEIQFTNNLNWENFGEAWQFDHIVPVAYFDFSIDEELRLCWNFINIRVEPIFLNKIKSNRVDVIAVKSYFEALNTKTGYYICSLMLEKINKIELSNIVSEPTIEEFIINRQKEFVAMSQLTSFEFAQLNRGVSLSNILLEREIIKKYG